MGGTGRGSLILILFLSSVSAHQTLNSIHDLRGIDFGHSHPRHGLLLLYWFANNIDINNNDIITPNFEPNRGDYGIHYYGNFERLLVARPGGSSYYTLGNLYPYNCNNNNNNNNNARALPQYVTQGFYNSRGNPDNNRDRIIIEVDRQRGTIQEVYITQHLQNQQQSAYDPAHTFRITTNLLREIRSLSVTDIRHITQRQIQQQYNVIVDQNSLNNLQISQGSFSLGLLLLIADYYRYKSQRYFGRRLQEVVALGADDDVLQMELEVIATSNGKAGICCGDIPSRFVRQNVMVVLYKCNDDENSIIYISVDSQDGCYETSVPLNPGLQVRLHNAVTHWYSLWSTVGEEIRRGPEFHDANRELPVYIPGHDASLQLFVKDGKACARLYVMKKFTDWETTFYYSWVGFYSDKEKATSGYSDWQWATRFTREYRSDWDDIPDYDIFVYHSTMAIAPGVQARFILQEYQDPLAYSPP